MIVDCIADLHGHYPQLEGGDLLIVAGDLTARDTHDEYSKFFNWLTKQDYEKAIVICGNHDNKLQEGHIPICSFDNVRMSEVEYLCDSGTEVTYYPKLEVPSESTVGKVYERKTFKIWGSPWTRTFEGMNPHCKAFTCDTEEELAEKWKLVPHDTDILITHGPPYGMLDQVRRDDTKWGRRYECVGSKSLQMEIFTRLSPKLLVFGHIHGAYGREPSGFVEGGQCINCSHVNEYYEPVNKPIRVIL